MRSPVLFFLHYATGDDRSFARIGLALSFFARYRKRGRLPPRVVSVSYGTHWVLSSEPGKRQVILLEPFLKTLKGLEPKPARRYLWGMSMGGYNSAVAALSAPEDWSAAVLSCPALHTTNPFQDSIEPELLGLPGARGENVRDGRALVRPGKLPSFLIEGNGRDEFGFAPGARALAAALREAGAAVEHRELPGGHCVIDGASVADFLIGLGSPEPAPAGG